MVRRSRHDGSDEEAQAEFDDGKESSKSYHGPSNKMFLTWMTYLCGAFGACALWHARGSNRVKYGKFATTHLLSIGAGAGGTYTAVFLVIPATYEHCVDAEEEEEFELYRGWYNDHHKAEFLKNGSLPTLPSPPNGPSTAARMKRSIKSEPNVTTPTMSSVTKGSTENISPVTLRTPTYPAATLVDQPAAPKIPDEPIQDESITGPYDARPLHHLRGTIATVLMVLYSNLAQLSLVAVICASCYEYGLKKSAKTEETASANTRSTDTSTVDHSEDSEDGSDGTAAGLYDMECRTTPTLPPTPPPRNTTV